MLIKETFARIVVLVVKESCVVSISSLVGIAERLSTFDHLLICELYRTQRVPPHAQYISSFDGERLMAAEEAATHSRISLIDTAISGNVNFIGRLISDGAIVNERDEHGRTLLHLIAMTEHVPNAYRVALELVRYGGRAGVDWEAVEDGLSEEIFDEKV